MKILVTGASGFIGGRFARFALEQSLDVRVNGRRAEGVEHLVRRGAEFIQGDLNDADLVRDLCRDVEAVVHCAGAVGLWGLSIWLMRGDWLALLALAPAALHLAWQVRTLNPAYGVNALTRFRSNRFAGALVAAACFVVGNA